MYGYIGKFQINSSTIPKLLFIKKCEQIGKLRVKSEDHVIYKLKELLVLSLSPPGSVQDESDSLASIECDLISLNNGNTSMETNNHPQTSHVLSPNISDTHVNKSSSYDSLSNLSDTNSNLTSPLPVSPSQNKISPNNATTPQNQRKQLSATTLNATQSNNTENNKFEKKIFEEIVKIFQDNNGSFYFSYTYDLTNSIERKQEQFEEIKLKQKEEDTILMKPKWKCVDEKFFWNKALLSELIDFDVSNLNRNDIDNFDSKVEQSEIIKEELKIRDNFILPLIQGFVQIENFVSTETDTGDVEVRIALISRRSRYRLGTRFKRRGVDENGNVANFVETEQVSIL